MSRPIRRDPKAFERVWNTLVMGWFVRHADEPGLSMPDPTASRDRLMSAYHSLNKRCSESYMDDPDSPLNQRKIAACLLFAIASTRPISIDMDCEGCTVAPPRPDGTLRKASMPFFANERLAIYTATSIILSYLEHAVKDSERCHLTEGQRKSALRKIEAGIDLMENRDGGDWILNLEKALALTAAEGNYNIPLASCLISYLEATVLDDETYREVLQAFERAAANSW